MKFREYLTLIADPAGFIPTPRLRWVIHKNPRKTAREEAIAAEIIEKANPRENITGRFPWGAEEQMVLQQLWIHPEGFNIAPLAGQPEKELVEWRDIPTKGAKELYSVEETEFGDLPVPRAINEPGTIQCDFQQRIREMLGEDSE